MQTATPSNVLDKKFVGADELRRELSDILKRLPKKGGVVVTQHGKPKGVLLGVDYYLELQELEEKIADLDSRLLKEINEGIAQVKAGKGMPAEEVFKKLAL